MRDAMLAADKAGAITGPSIKKALEEMRDHVPAGLEGVCLPTTFTPEDHRGTTTVILYRNDFNFAVPRTEGLHNDRAAPARTGSAGNPVQCVRSSRARLIRGSSVPLGA